LGCREGCGSIRGAGITPTLLVILTFSIGDPDQSAIMLLLDRRIGLYARRHRLCIAQLVTGVRGSKGWSSRTRARLEPIRKRSSHILGNLEAALFRPPADFLINRCMSSHLPARSTVYYSSLRQNMISYIYQSQKPPTKVEFLACECENAKTPSSVDQACHICIGCPGPEHRDEVREQRTAKG
jgi:hypothetical protein